MKPIKKRFKPIKSGIAFSDYLLTESVNKKRSNFSFLQLNIGFFPILLLIILFSILFLRMFYLSVIRGSYYKDLSENNRTRRTILLSPRGIIYDRNNKPLVRNVPSFKRIVDKKVEWLEKNEALQYLASSESAKFIYVDTRREYLYQDAFNHVLGYVGLISENEINNKRFEGYHHTEFVGKNGLEYQYEKVLHGIPGEELYEVNAQGNIIRKLGLWEGKAGRNIYTTLDSDLQLNIVNAMKAIAVGAAVAIDPRDGAILALYSKPTFDPNLFTNNEEYKASGLYKSIDQLLKDTTSQPFLNRAISGLYPPGSTYKLITAIAALSSNKVTRGTQIEDTGILHVGKFSFSNWFYTSYGKTDGVLDLPGAIKRSNDIYFYKIAESTGVDKIYEVSKEFGLGAKLGIDLPAEESGLVPSRKWKKETVGEDWYLGDTYNLGIGQGYLLTTPLQVGIWTAVFANGGTLYTPHIEVSKKNILRENFIKHEHIQTVRDGMRAACENGGTAYPFFEFRINNSKLKVDNLNYFESATSGAKLVKVSVGCKTGTAETTSTQEPHAWFTIFAPFTNPEIVVTVFIEYGGEGSQDAAPIAKKILERYFEEKK